MKELQQAACVKSETHGDLNFEVEGVNFEMVSVEGGTFSMGATFGQDSDAWGNEMPMHCVTLGGFHIGKTEVTQALWKAVMGVNPSEHKGLELPVERVSWEDCMAFIEKLNALTGWAFRLPTEAEWEFACRGGSKGHGYKYSGSDNVEDVAWHFGNSGGTPHPVGTKAPNELGIYDMSGNVCEWCFDWFGDYCDEVQANPTGPESGARRISRGGSWNCGAGCCRPSHRSFNEPTFRYCDLGLRLAL